MFTAKRQWIFSLFIIVFLLTSLAITDASQAALLKPGANTPFQAASSGGPGRELQVYTPQTADKIENGLLTAIEENGNADFIVRFTNQADLSAANSMDWDARGEFVYNILRDTAYRSQANAKVILDAQGLAYQTFIAGNELYVWGGNQQTTNGLTVVNELAALPEVSYIRATRTYYIDPIVEIKPFDNINWAGDLLVNHLMTTVGSSTEAIIDWGITDTKADQFWTAFGVQGDGIVVANIDTGVDYTHVALDQSYKCLADPSSPACWLDPGTADCTGVAGGPCDTIYKGIYHGTHTMGTMVGDDDPSLANQVGMAPNAQWIACLGLPNGSGTDADINACADWILAPGGDPANRPDVVNNSWGSNGGDNWFEAKVQAWVAAGIFPAFSAGNSGSQCSTLDSPGDYQESFGSAAHDSSRTIASFSSRGASTFGHSPYTKPNLSAPGVSVMSTKPGDRWELMSGTSMASPHSAGAVALLWSCNPALVGQVDATFQVLQNNTDTAPAGNCGAPPDGQGNYTFGYGYLNALKAGLAGCAPTAVDLVDFRATSISQAIQLDWQTAQEINLLGFNLFRAEALDGPRVQITPEIIPAINPGQLRGNDYNYADTTAEVGKTYYYWVEWVGKRGSELYGPVTASLAHYLVWLPFGLK
jgi:subtilisin family serine protease